MSLDCSIVPLLLLKALHACGKVLSDTGDIGFSSVPFESVRIPIRDLNTNEHADDDNDEVNHTCKPVVGLYVLVEAAWNHRRRYYDCIRRTDLDTQVATGRTPSVD